LNGDEDVGLRNLIIDGVNGYDLVQLKNPVVNPPFNNWSINQPSVTHARGMNGDEDVGLRNLIIDGVNGFDLVQTQESEKPKQKEGMNGDEDLGLHMNVGGDKVNVA